METPEYEEYSDLSRPQNFQDVVKYIENRSNLYNIILPMLEKNAEHSQGNIYKDNFNNQDNTGDLDDYDLNRALLNELSFKNGKLGTFFMDDIHMDPPPTLPDDFAEMDSEEKRESIMNLLEMEQRSIQDTLNQIDENRQRNINQIQRLIDINEANLHNSRQNQMQEVNFGRESHNPPHFVDVHQADMDPLNIQSPTVTVGFPLERNNFGAVPNFYNGQDAIVQHAQEGITQPRGLQESVSIDPNTDSTLGYLFQVPDRRFSDDYLRLERSLNETTLRKFDELLQKEKEVINSLTKGAKHDEDLIMIGYIGDSLIDDLEKRRNKTKRAKRELGSSGVNLPINRLFTDPRAKLDVPKTLENLGAATRNVFEHEKAPLYHVRNMVGSAQDAVVASMKIPANNFVIPSTYDIVNTQLQDNGQVGAINPSLFPSSDNQNLPEGPTSDGITTTFNKVGSAVRGSVLSGQEALNHVGKVAEHAKNAMHSSRYAVPRLILKQIPAVTREPLIKTSIITPSILGVSGGDTTRTNSLGQPDYIKLGHILDAIGVSNPNTRDAKLEKITIEPNTFSDLRTLLNRPPKFSNTFKDILGRMRIEEVEHDDDAVGNALNALDNAKTTLGVKSLRDFIVKMKRDLDAVFRNEAFSGGSNLNHNKKELKDVSLPGNKLTLENILMHVNPIKSHMLRSREANVQHENTDFTGNFRTLSNPYKEKHPVDLDQAMVQASLYPQELQQPFMGQVNELEIQHLRRINNEENEDVHRSEADMHLEKILGAINPMMFERMFNETLKEKNISATPYSIFHHHQHWHSHGQNQVDDEAKLGTSMALTEQMLKPFMGHVSNKANQKLKRLEDTPQHIDFGTLSEVPEWVEILYPYQEADLDY